MEHSSGAMGAGRGTPPHGQAADASCMEDRFLVQVAVLRPEADEADDMIERIRTLDHGQVRTLEHVVNVWLHVNAPDRDTAVARVREQLDGRLEPGERQQVLAVVAFRQR